VAQTEDLSQKQRVALSRLVEPRHEGGRQNRCEVLGRRLADLVDRETAERQERCFALHVADPRQDVSRRVRIPIARRRDHHDTTAPDVARDEVEQSQTRGISGVQVVEHHQQRHRLADGAQ
jgi:hypothetical protein